MNQSQNQNRAARAARHAAVVGAAVAMLALAVTGAGRPSSATLFESGESAPAAPIADGSVPPPIPAFYVTARDIRDIFPH